MLSKYFKKADLLSKSPTLNFRGESRIVSGFGGVLTIIYVCFAVLASIYIGQELFVRKSPSLVFGTQENEDNKVFLKDYPIAISFKDFYGRDLTENQDFLNSINITVRINHLTGSGLEYAIFKVRPCDSAFVDPVFLEKAFAVSEGSFLCPDFSVGYDSDGQIVDPGYFINKEFGEPGSSFLGVIVEVCDKSKPECKEFNHPNGVYYFAVTTYDSFSEPSNYESPIKKRVNQLTGQVTKSFYTRQYIHIDYNLLTTDDGWFMTEERSDEFYSIGESRFEIADFLEDFGFLYQFTLTSPSRDLVTTRTYLKVPEIIAFVGGFSKAVLTGLKVILDLYTKYWFKIEVIHDFKTKTEAKLDLSVQPIRFESNANNRIQPSEQAKSTANTTLITNQPSHIKQFFASLFFSSHLLNKKYNKRLENLDVINIMRTVEAFENFTNPNSSAVN